ncbi:MAG: transcriptional regulator [Ahrensia sp.]|nr:transcriptional regulator [Ahrensia sp.]
MRRFIPPILALAVSVLAGIAPLRAAELIMFEQAGCVWCAKWNAEIAPAYAKSAEGKIAPLRRVDIHAPLPEDLSGIRIERFTPTFVLVDNGEEIGRMRGYTGDEFFWFLLGEMLDKLDGAKAG